MVIVEFPLWVAHSTEASSTTSATHDSAHNVKAAQALNMLQTKKSAMYGVDCHPDGTRFATAGGDGTVRIWSTAPLFSNKHRGKIANELAHQSNSNSLTMGGGGLVTSFVSSSSSSSGSDHDDLTSPINGSGNLQNASRESTGSNKPSSSDEEEQIRDLNSLVRRKKDGQSPARPLRPQASPPLKAATKSQFAQKLNTKSNEPPRLLATLSAHTGSSVLAVRFSTTGKYLASAGDDAVVCIYERSNVASAASGNLTGHYNHHHHHAHAEHWIRIHCCRGHELDVVDLAWAPDDSYLVSCSLDSQTPIIVWKIADDFDSRNSSKGIIKSPYKVLGRGVHTSTVKGVCFDPAGSYIASSGDDPAVCIWRAHDDWGLEQRIDASSGIFRQWHANDDSVSLSSQSLFRRISWATDGAFLCSTNSVVKNKHVASTISRQSWNVSSGSHVSTGAANLVGHKQPVVVSRHAPQMLSAKKRRERALQNDEIEHEADDEAEDDEDEEPQHAMLLALGDKRGFVTVWSTKKSRPIFKLQCSESRCTVTDLSWLKLPTSDNLVLLISLLDGQLVAVNFAVPSELGALLSKKDQARVFQLRYGIDADDNRLFVGRSTGIKIVENPLQMTLEDQDMNDADGGDNPFPDDVDNDKEELSAPQQETQAKQKESRIGGKKRVQPMLVSLTTAPEKRARVDNSRDKELQERRKSLDPVQNALDAAEKANAAIQAAHAQKERTSHNDATIAQTNAPSNITLTAPARPAQLPATNSFALPFSTETSHSAELPLRNDFIASHSDPPASFMVECKNSNKTPSGSIGSSMPCIDIAISSVGKVSWKEQIAGTSCCAIAASLDFLAVGTSDGTIQLYSTSPSMGWACGVAFRSHPTIVIGQAPVNLRLNDQTAATGEKTVSMMIVSADGGFAVYTLLPQLKLQYKGTIVPAMTHMTHSACVRQGLAVPNLSRIQVTESGHLLMLLSLEPATPRTDANGNYASRSMASALESIGGSVQAFVYNVDAELWMRVSDSRFLLSDFYSVNPSRNNERGRLIQWDDLVRIGSAQSQLKANRRLNADSGEVRTIYNSDEESIFEATRVHCEDRMACAMAFGEANEFEHWLRLYIRTLTRSGNVDVVRIVVDMLKTDEDRPLLGSDRMGCWWMSQASSILGLGRTTLLKSIVIPELSKNRSLQRLTNEINLEVSNL